MEALFEALIRAWCRLLVAASPLLFGLLLGALLYYLVGGGPLGRQCREPSRAATVVGSAARRASATSGSALRASPFGCGLSAFGLVLLVAAAVAGLIAGVLWSSRIARRGELVEYSSGMPLPPAKDAANESEDGTPKAP